MSSAPSPVADQPTRCYFVPQAIIAGIVGHFLLPKPGTPKELYTSANKTGGAVLIAFAVLQIMCFSFFCEWACRTQAAERLIDTD